MTLLPDGRYVYQFGPEIQPRGVLQFELSLEPLIGGGYALALYENYPGQQYPLLSWPEKVPVMPMTPLVLAMLADISTR